MGILERPVHLSGLNGRTSCCDRSGPLLGAGARVTLIPDEVTCPHYVRRPEPTLRLREGDQPLPTPNDEPDVQSQLIGEIEGRRALGIQRYGTALQPFNGRDSLRDLLDELLDGATYALQVRIERDALLARIAELEAEIAALQRPDDGGVE